MPPFDPLLQGIIDAFLNSNPTAAFQTVFNPMLHGRNSNFNSWLGSQANDYQNQFLGTLSQNPEANYMDFLKMQNPVQMFQAMSPRARGEHPGTFAPPVRFIGGL